MNLNVMKEHTMKRLIVLLATLLLSFGLISAADQVDVNAYTGSTLITPGDTIWDNGDYAFGVSIANDSTVWGQGHGFEITGDAPLSWVTMPDGFPGTPGAVDMVTLIAGSRMTATTWDLGGFQANEYDLDGVLPDIVFFGGAAYNNGLLAGPWREWLISTSISAPLPPKTS
jgi:hypothetical protein